MVNDIVLIALLLLHLLLLHLVYTLIQVNPLHPIKGKTKQFVKFGNVPLSYAVEPHGIDKSACDVDHVMHFRDQK